MPLRIIGLVLAALPVDPAQAHGLIEGAGTAQLPEILGGLLLILLWLSYCIGARRVRPTTGRALVFHGANLIAALIMFVPLEGWIENGSAMHMIQHMLIMVVIAPLYVVARPLPQWLAASGRMGVSLRGVAIFE